MRRLLRFLFTGDWHLHNWEIYHTIDVYGNGINEIPTGTKIIQKCIHCGTLKEYTIT